MKLFKQFFITVLIGLGSILQAQVIYNNGSDIFISNSAIVFVAGNVENSTGNLTNNGDFTINNNFVNDATTNGSGTIYLFGDWINNSNFSGNSTVNLQGAAQNISGSALTTFYNLNLLGTGVKTANLNVNISNILDLTDKEFSLGDNICFIQNTDINAITLTTGFCSSSLNGGLSRETNTVSDYLYPLGSNLGTLRYRPLQVKPTSTNANTFVACFVNNDATNDGFNRTQTDTGICDINAEFYHRIERTSGTDSADVSINYSETNDGLWEDIVYWDNSANNWKKLQNITQVSGTPFNTITSSHWSDLVNYKPIALSKADFAYDIVSDTGLCTGSTIDLDAGSGYSSYSWSTGANTQTINVHVAGTYYVTVSDGSCSANDSIVVIEDTPPNIDIEKMKIICAGDSVSILASGGGDYYWSSGDTTALIWVSPPIDTQYFLTVTNGYCSDTASSMIYVNPLPNAEAGNDEAICDGDTVTLTASGGEDYLWSTGETTASINVSPSSITTYYVEVTDTNHCSAIDSVVVESYTTPVAITSNDTNICEGENIDIWASGGSSYQWSTTETDSTINVSPSSTSNYYVTVSNGSCSDYDTVTVNVTALPTISITASNTQICEGDDITLTANGNAPYLWSTGDTTQVITQTVTANTSYSVTVSNNSCENSDFVDINVYQKPTSQLSDANICQNDSTNLFVSSNTSYTYVWTDSLNNMILTNPNNPIVFPNTDALYYVTIINGVCQVNDSANVIVHNLPNVSILQNDTSIEENTSINLNVITDSTNTVLWSPNLYLNSNTIFNPVASPETDITYYVNVTNQYSCSSLDSVSITIVKDDTQHPLIIYNTFTPNNDGTNDFFYIENIEYYSDNYLVVYNRDGHVVYETDNYENKWDGKYYGTDLPAATYYYVLKINSDGSIYKGNVTIIR